MAERKVIYKGSDNLLEFNGVTDVAASAALPAGTCTGRLYDRLKDTSVRRETFALSADEVAAQTNLSINEVEKVTVADGDTVRVHLDDGTHFDASLAAGSTTSSLILASGLPSLASKGSIIELITKVAGVNQLRLETCRDPYTIGDQVSIDQDDGTRHVTTVSDYDEELDLITLAAVTTGAVSAGNDVARKLGADISMVVYGTPIANDTDWGYRGIVADTHADLEKGQRGRAELDFDGGAGLKRIGTLLFDVI